jgi:hypothetical protein
VGSQSGWVSVEGGGMRGACQVAVGLLCVEWFARFFLSVCVGEASRRCSESGRHPCSCCLDASLFQWPL